MYIIAYAYTHIYISFMQTGKPLVEEGDGEHLVYIIKINYCSV